MDPNENQTAHDAEADTALTPSATEEGASSSDAADEAHDFSVDDIAREFRETYGTDEPAEPGESDGEPAQESAPEEAEAATSEQTPEEEDQGDDDEFRIPDDEFKALPDGVKKRLGHLNTRAKKATRELEAMQKEMVPLKDAHQRFTQLQTFVQEHQIEPKNVTVAFNAMAAMSRGDYKQFLELVEPWFNHARLAMGAAIAPDLQSRVDEGYLTEEDARELTKARLQSQISQGRVEALTAQQRQAQAAQQHTLTTEKVIAAVHAREAEIKASDPDYARKQPAMHAMVEFALKGGAFPKNEDEARKLINDAYERASNALPKAQPPKATSPRPTASTPPRGNPAPKDDYEVAFQALQGMSGA